MAIIRNPNRSNFTIIDNRVLEDTRLSWGARGMAAYLLSKPDTWEVMRQHLINQSPGGRGVVDSILEELGSFGYITREEQPRGERGRFDSVTTIVHEVPTSGFPTNAQVAPRAKIDNGGKAQVGTDACFPRAVGREAVGRLAVDLPRVRTDISITEEVRTEGEGLAAQAPQPLVPEDDAEKQKAQELTALAFEQTPQPVTRGGRVAVFKRIEAELRVGTDADVLAAAIREGVTAWTADALRIDVARATRRGPALPELDELLARLRETEQYEPGPAIEPITWTPERIAERERRLAAEWVNNPLSVLEPMRMDHGAA